MLATSLIFKHNVAITVVITLITSWRNRISSYNIILRKSLYL